MNPDWRRRLLVAMGSVVVAALSLRFSPHAFSTGLPENPGDPAFTLWTLDWVWHELSHGSTRLFNAPVFAPRPYGLTWSDPLLGIAPIYGLFRTLGAGRILAWNLTELSLVTMTISATYALTRRLTQRTDAACIAGVVMGCGGFLSVHQPHLQMLAVGLFPLSMWLLLVVWDERKWWQIVLCAMAIGSLMTTALYFAAIAPLVLGIMTLVYLGQHRRDIDASWWRATALVGVIAAMITAPVVVTYLRAQRLPGTSTRARIADSSFRPIDLVVPKPGAPWSSALKSLGAQNLRWERTFSIGSLALIAALVGFATWARSHRNQSASDFIAVAAGSLGAVALSLGPRVAGLPGPLGLMEHVIPGLDDVRVPARLAAPGLIVFAVLAGVGLSWVTQRLANERGGWLMALAGLVIVVENLAPVHRVRIDTHPLVNQALASQPNGIVLELPFVDPTRDGNAWAFVEAPRMVAARVDDHPRVNGYSGSFPTDYVTTAQMMAAPTSTEARRRLAEIGVRYVIVHGAAQATSGNYSASQAAEFAQALGVATAHGDDWLVELSPPPA
jgi:hypothetical protein